METLSKHHKPARFRAGFVMNKNLILKNLLTKGNTFNIMYLGKLDREEEQCQKSLWVDLNWKTLM